MTPREVEEYRALRATIRERGTTRIWVVLAGFVAWAALTVATYALVALPVATLVPLLLLVVTFEISFTVHTAVERIGRYIQVAFETDPLEAGWERYVMAYGRSFRVRGSDPLFCTHFWIATLLNLAPALLTGPVPIEWSSVGAIHLLFAVRVLVARRDAGRQRALELERFKRLREQGVD